MKIVGARSRTGVTFTRQDDGTFSKVAKSVKSFDAAGFNRLTSDWQVSRLSADAEAQGKIEILRSRSRDHEQNEPLQESYLKLRENNIVGEGGFTLQMKAIISESLDPETGARKIVLDHPANRAIERAWIRFCMRKNFLVTRDQHAIEACKLIERTGQRDGDMLIRKISGAPNEFGFALQLFEGDYLDDRFIDFRGVQCNCPNERTLPNGKPFPYCERGMHEVRMGVELHGDWKFPVAYWLLGNHPGDYFFGNQYATRRIRVPVEEIIHPFTKKRPEQTRGIPSTVAAMLRLQMIGGMNEAAVVMARAGAQKMGVITKQVPNDFQVDEDYADGLGRTIEGAPGEFLELPMGFDIKSIDWKTPDNSYAPFLKTQQYDVAAAMGVACHALTGDLASVNFSTARIGDTQQRDTFRGGQGAFVRDILLEIFPDFLQAAMLSGIVDLPFSRFDAYTDPEAVYFHGRGFDYFDPEKDVAADLAAIEGNLTTRADVIAERTRRDFEEVAAELGREKEILEDAGLGEPEEEPAEAEDDERAVKSSEFPFKGWVTTEEGNHIFIDDQGNAHGGGAAWVAASPSTAAAEPKEAKVKFEVVSSPSNSKGWARYSVKRDGQKVIQSATGNEWVGGTTKEGVVMSGSVFQFHSQVQLNVGKGARSRKETTTETHHMIAEEGAITEIHHDAGSQGHRVRITGARPARPDELPSHSNSEQPIKGWVTMNGAHVLIGEGGAVTSGPSELIGTKPYTADHARATDEANHASNEAHMKGPLEHDHAAQKHREAHAELARHIDAIKKDPKMSEELKKGTIAYHRIAQRHHAKMAVAHDRMAGVTDKMVARAEHAND